MGTRSLTVINDEWKNEEICVLYRQYDGYPEGHGKDLLDFLKGINVVNGINSDSDGKKISNGMDCLAAQIVAYFKTGPGYFYLNAAGSRDMCEEFIYTIYIYNKNELFIKVEDTYDEGHVLFDGNLKEYEEWLSTPKITEDKNTNISMAEAAEYKI